MFHDPPRHLLAVVLVAAALAAPATASDCLALRIGTEDFDQKRAEGEPGVEGLPGDGGSYCYPTTWMSWMAYLNQNGYPEAMRLSEEIPDWAAPGVYNWASLRIKELGQLCGTNPNPGGGTPSPNGVVDYLESVGLGDQFFFLVHSVDFSDPVQFVPPHVNPFNIEQAIVAGGMPSITIGWSDLQGGIHRGAGAHVVGAAGTLGSCDEAVLLMRNPSSSDDELTQSPFVFQDTTFTPVIGDYQRGSSPVTSKRLWQLDRFGANDAFLLGIRTLYPTYACAIPEALQEIVIITPRSPRNISIPVIRRFPLPPNFTINRALIHPSGRGTFVLADFLDLHLLLWLDPLAGDGGALNLVPDIEPDSGPIAADRFGDIYFLQDEALTKIRVELGEAEIAAEVLGQVPVPAPAAMAINDVSDLLYMLLPARPGWKVHAYDLGLRRRGSWTLPESVDLGEEISQVITEDGREMWLASAAAPDLYRFEIDPATGEPTLRETLQLQAVVSPTSLQVTRTGRIIAMSEGEVFEYTPNPENGGYRQSDETGFAGYEGYRSIGLTCSRSNARRFARPEDRPDWPEIIPELDETPCPGDANYDGHIDFADLLIALAGWGPCGMPCPGDVTEDATVDFSDVLLVLSNWGPCPE